MDAPKKIGRPSIFTQELADKLCGELAQGRSVRSVCAEDEMPCAWTVFSWLRTNEEFLAQYTRAKEESADALTDEMLDIADDRSEDPQSRRVRVDTRKWIASKLKPKKYGDKLDLNGKFDGTLALSGRVVFVEPDKEPQK